MVRKITRDDREIFLALTREFYASDAVLHDVPDAYHTDAFAEMMRSQAYISGYLIECDGAVAGYGAHRPFVFARSGRAGGVAGGIVHPRGIPFARAG